MEKFQVCPICEGEGRRSPETFRGLLDEDTVQDEEFMKNFMAGHYDVTCECCGGKRVVTKEELQTFQDCEEHNREIQHERMMLGDW